MPTVNAPFGTNANVDLAVTRRVGVQVAAARRRAGLTLAAVAERGGVSPAHLSQMESGSANPTLRTLGQVADALDTDVAALFGVAAGEAFAPRHAPQPLAAAAGGPPGRFDLTAPGSSRLVVRLLHADVGDHVEPVSHPGEEVLTVLRGRCTVHVDGDRFDVGTGDVVHLAATAPHHVTDVSPDLLVSVVVTVG